MSKTLKQKRSSALIGTTITKELVWAPAMTPRSEGTKSHLQQAGDILLACVLVLGVLCSVVPLQAEELPRLARAYADSSRFNVHAAETSISVGPITVRQPAYAGDTVRPDDTVGAKLARMLSLTKMQDTTPKTEVVIIDQSSPATWVLPAPDSDTRRICAVLPLPLQGQSDNSIAPLLQANGCPSGSEGSLPVELLKDPMLTKRIRLTDNQLNEIGHRIAAEDIFMQLLDDNDLAAVITSPPLYRSRINIHPEKNERLATHVTSDS